MSAGAVQLTEQQAPVNACMNNGSGWEIAAHRIQIDVRADGSRWALGSGSAHAPQLALAC